MDRRGFLASSGFVAASGLLGVATADNPPARAPVIDTRRIDFRMDGLGLLPHEYAALLQEVAAGDGFQGDNYSNGGAIAQLEQVFAEKLGKEAAVFLPTGTLANLLAVRTLAGTDRRVLVQAESHLYNDSGDGATELAGLNLVPLASGAATIPLEEVKAWVERSRSGRVPTPVGVLAIENPVRRRDHAMVDPGELERVCKYAREQGIRLHLDGARMFHLPQHSGRPLREVAALFDTVYVSLWKHFNAASGAILAGDARTLEGLYHVRRMFGGSLPYAWPAMAVAARYVDGYEAEYAQSWAAAEALIERLEADGRFAVRRVPNGTSRFFLSVPAASAQPFVERLRERGILLGGIAPGSNEIAMQVNPGILRIPPAELADMFVAAVA
jgi:threonine aldolase